MSLAEIIAINRARLGLDAYNAGADRQFSLNTGAISRLCIYGRMRPGGPDAHRLTPLGGSWAEGTFPGELQGDTCTLDECPGLAWKPTERWNTGFVLTSDKLTSAWDDLDAKEGEKYARLLTPVKVGDNEIIANVYTSRAASLNVMSGLDTAK